VTSPPEILETKRLRLRKPVPSDARIIFQTYAQDPEVTKYLTWRPHRSLKQTDEFVRECLWAWDNGKSFHWVIVRQEDDRLLGMITARVDDHGWELGYVLARPYWGLGYMSEVVKKLVNLGLAQEGIYRVWSVCDVDNLASARVMEKAGMQREGILRRWSMHPTISDEPRDSYCYSITK
jgi:[ribosomal protein S5]-alanine N-acetyltransferase